MLEQVRDVPGHDLDPESYGADFWPYFDRISDVFWKLERIQDFREAGSPSWVAMTEGDWDRSLRLLGTGHADAKKHDQQAGFARRRVRIAEHPVSPYLQWEMQYLRLRTGAGEQVRILPAESVRHLEARQPLPELVVLGTQVLYAVLYDETGRLAGARRIDDPDVIAACRQEISELYDKSEDLLPYFDREIAPLPPPVWMDSCG